MENRRPATDDEARALASATRVRIIRLCLDRALTNKEIAQRLGANPATTLHHVRTLVATGFLAAQEERRGARGSREVPYASTGKSWTLDVHGRGTTVVSQAMIQAFMEEVELVNLDGDRARFTRLGLRLDEAAFTELEGRIKALLEEYADRQPDRDGVPYSIFVAMYEDVSRDRPAPRSAS